MHTEAYPSLAVVLDQHGQRFQPGTHVHGKSVSDVIGRTMRRAGIQGAPHALRHWYATTSR